MNNSNTGQQLRYLEEISISLHRAGFETKPPEDCQLPILWNDAPLCRITGKGSVFYRREDADTPRAEDALYRVEDIAAKTLEYMTAMESAPQLKASGLDGDYRKLKHQSLPILEQMLETLRTIRDRRLLWSEDIVSLNKKISELSSQNQTLAFLKQNGLVDPDIFISKSNELTRQLRQAKLDKEELMAAEGDATAQRTRELIALLEDGPDFLDRPDTELCGALVAEIIVESNDTLRFRLHNGLELRESIERTVR